MGVVPVHFAVPLGVELCKGTEILPGHRDYPLGFRQGAVLLKAHYSHKAHLVPTCSQALQGPYCLRILLGDAEVQGIARKLPVQILRELLHGHAIALLYAEDVRLDVLVFIQHIILYEPQGLALLLIEKHGVIISLKRPLGSLVKILPGLESVRVGGVAGAAHIQGQPVGGVQVLGIAVLIELPQH